MPMACWSSMQVHLGGGVGARLQDSRLGSCEFGHVGMVTHLPTALMPLHAAAPTMQPLSSHHIRMLSFPWQVRWLLAQAYERARLFMRGTVSQQGVSRQHH